MRKKWSEEELSILQKWYRKDIQKCKQLLPNRTDKAIGSQAYLSGLTKPDNPNWSEEEDQILRDNFPDRELISELTGRTLSAVKNRCIKLGLTMYSVWSKEEDQYIIENYPTEDIEYMSQHLDRSFGSIRARSNYLNVSRKGYKKGRKHTFDDNLFSFPYLRNKDEASLLGNIYADGNVSRSSLKFNVAQKDYPYLQQIKNFTKATNDIIDLGKRKGVTLSIHSVDLLNQLQFFGIFRNKVFQLKYPSQEILNGFEIDFIRGYFEGDGCITYTKNGGCRTTFVGTEDVVWNIREFFVNNLNLNPVKITKEGKTHRFTYSGRIQCAKIGKLIYSSVLDGSANLFMERKLSIYKQIWNDLNW